MSNQFLSFAAAGGANVVSQGTYNGAAWRADGFSAGVAESNQLNKVWRQAANMASAIGAMIDAKGGNALDDGNINNLRDALIAAIEASAWSTGDTKLSCVNAAPSGWILMNDGTIGSAGSGATTRANADTEALYTVLWNDFTDGNCPVSGGRGGSAALDFAADKTIRLPLVRGRALGAAGNGAGLSNRMMGETVGEETHGLTTAELAEHRHFTVAAGDDDEALTAANSIIQESHSGGDTEYSLNSDAGATEPTIGRTSPTGDGDAHNNMQPTSFLRLIVKL